MRGEQRGARSINTSPSWVGAPAQFHTLSRASVHPAAREPGQDRGRCRTIPEDLRPRRRQAPIRQQPAPGSDPQPPRRLGGRCCPSVEAELGECGQLFCCSVGGVRGFCAQRPLDTVLGWPPQGIGPVRAGHGSCRGLIKATRGNSSKILVMCGLVVKAMIQP